MTATIDPLLLPASFSRPAVRPAARPARPAKSAGQARTAARPSDQVFRRRRMAVVAIAVFALASALFVSGAFATQPTARNLQSVPRTHVVEAGETLWTIARQYVPTGNISDLVHEMARENGVDIEVGQIVRIP